MNGFFNIDKEFGVSSAKCVAMIKKKFGIKDKIGHMGTLDPNATGVLVVGVGRANRLFEVMLKKRKTYIATFEFGYETETLDAESDVIVKRCEKIPTQDEIENNLNKMLGSQLQFAPQYSAKNINGRRAYDLAREGKDFEIKPHNIEIYSFCLIEKVNETTYKFKIECSGGTYIRSICRDFSKLLDTVGTMTALRRVACGDFLIEDSKTVESITESDLINNDFALKHIDKILLTKDEIQRIKNGQKIKTDNKKGKYKLFEQKTLIGIVDVDDSGITTIPTWLV